MVVTTTGSPAPTLYLYRNGVLVGTITSPYTYQSADVGVDLTVVAKSSAGSALSNTLAYVPTQFSNLKLLVDNHLATVGSFSSGIADRSPGLRTLSTDATTSKQPVGRDRSWSVKGEPVISFSDGDLQYAQDTAGDAPTYYGYAHMPGSGCVCEIQLGDAAAGSQLFGSWIAGSSSTPAFAAFWIGTAGSEQLKIFTVSGGVTHVNAATPAGALRAKDRVRFVFRNELAKTWTLDVTRMARDINDNGGHPTVLTTVSGSYATTPSGNASSGWTFGAYGNLSAPFHAMRLHLMASFTIGASTTSDIADLVAYLSNRCDYNVLTADVYQPLNVVTDFNADLKHQNDSGHAKLAAAIAIAEQAVIDELGATGTFRVMAVTDSRKTTAASVVGTTDWAALLAAHPFTGGVAHVGYGPVDDGGGNPASKFGDGQSGWIHRSVAGTPGHSPRTPHAGSLDAVVNAVSGTHPLADLYIDYTGINEVIGVGTSLANFWDFGDEAIYSIEFRVEQRRLKDGVTPAFILVLEPGTGTTTNGLAQSSLRALNVEQGSAGVAFLRAKYPGIIIKVVDPNDYTINAP
jgi:hypothetical protein